MTFPLGRVGALAQALWLRGGLRLRTWTRWNLICCYNAARNDPFFPSHHPQYTALEKVPDTAIKQMGLQLSVSSESFYKPDEASISRAHTAK